MLTVPGITDPQRRHDGGVITIESNDMPNATTPARRKAGFRIQSESRDGRRFFLSCGCGAEFCQPRSSITVECPACGNTAMMIDLALDYRCGQRVA